jgi:hypothetical protein
MRDKVFYAFSQMIKMNSIVETKSEHTTKISSVVEWT